LQHAADPLRGAARQLPWRWLPALALVVTAAHLWLVNTALPDSLGAGAGAGRTARMDVAFVRELAPAAVAPAVPAKAAKAAKAALAPRQAAPPAAEPAASSPAPAKAPEPEPPAPPAPPVQAMQETPPTAQVLAPVADAAASAPAAAPDTTAVAPTAAAPGPATNPALEWPPSTRLSYSINGDYRGPVQGQARVEWLRSGKRYQVFMDLSIGPSFAPLVTRRVSSEGDITAAGLAPRRYEEETKAVLRDARRLTVVLDETRVRLANGTEVPRPSGVQDSASQFVQLTWLFTNQPDLLQPGRTVEVPLALPRSVQPWVYEVLGVETLYTPAGPVAAVHLKPQREAKPGGDLTAELWVAPSLQYLPVRILIRQDAQTYMDLLIERLPQQAVPGR
jgi:Protein of unknown function (DUF3108)